MKQIFKVFFLIFGILSSVLLYAQEKKDTASLSTKPANKEWSFSPEIEKTFLAAGIYENSADKLGIELTGDFGPVYHSYFSVKDKEDDNGFRKGFFADLSLKYAFRFDTNSDEVDTFKFEGPEIGFTAKSYDDPFFKKEFRFATLKLLGERDMRENVRAGVLINPIALRADLKEEHIGGTSMYSELCFLGNLMSFGLGYLDVPDNNTRTELLLDLPSIQGCAAVGVPDVGEIKASLSASGKIIDVGSKASFIPQNTVEASTSLSIGKLGGTPLGLYYEFSGVGNFGDDAPILQHSFGAQAAW